ncbi:MAG: DUF1080 domain-containing protein [Planctomycetes bacterium]|nr:DUF1080 domain-containing protein [Planctomycetota bacterium]
MSAAPSAHTAVILPSMKYSLLAPDASVNSSPGLARVNERAVSRVSNRCSVSVIGGSVAGVKRKREVDCRSAPRGAVGCPRSPNLKVAAMRLLSCVLLLGVSCAAVLAADEFKLEPGYKLLFNGKNLDGWQTKAAKDGKGEKLDGKTEAYGKRYVVKDGELVIDPAVKGDRYIETATPLSGDFTIRFDFKPDDKCNNDLLFMGTKFDINPTAKNLKIKVGEWNKMEIVAKGGNVAYSINGESAGTKKATADKGPFILRAEFGGIAIKNFRMTDGK